MSILSLALPCPLRCHLTPLSPRLNFLRHGLDDDLVMLQNPVIEKEVKR